MTLYQKLTKSLTAIGFKKIGFKKTTSDGSVSNWAIHRTWWSGPKFNINVLTEILEADELKVKSFKGSIFGTGWEFSKPADPQDPDWCLSIFKNNELGELEADGFDTTDLQ